MEKKLPSKQRAAEDAIHFPASVGMHHRRYNISALPARLRGLVEIDLDVPLQQAAKSFRLELQAGFEEVLESDMLVEPLPIDDHSGWNTQEDLFTMADDVGLSAYRRAAM